MRLLVKRANQRKPTMKVQVNGMGNHIALCLETEALKNPRVLGLADENLRKQRWLTLYCNGLEARRQLLHAHGINEVWVLSTDNVDMINLAAALKRDNPKRLVCCIAFSPNGSTLSRARAAGIDCVLNKTEFLKRYAEKKMSESSDAIPDQQTRVDPRRLWGNRHETKTSRQADNSQLKQLEVTPTKVEQTHLLQPGKARAFHTEHIDIEEPSFGNYRNDAKPGELPVPLRERSRHVVASPTRAREEQRSASKTERIAFNQFARKESLKEAFVLAVVSGSGGTGKSSVALLSALYAQRLGKKTLLVDADLQFGDLKLLLGREKSLEVSDLMANPERIKSLKPEGNLPALLSSPKRLEQSELIVNRMGDLLHYLKGFFDVIVVNTGAFWSEQHAQLLEQADRTLFLLDQRPSSIKACSHALSLCARCGIATQSFVFMLNFCSRQSLVSALDVSCALKGARVVELRDGGRDVAELLGSGLPEELIAARNPFVESLFAALKSIIPHDDQDTPAPPAKHHPLKRRPFGRKKRVACL